MGASRAGLRIDDTFEIVQNLGKGGVGSVYLARYKGDCLVAVKLLGSSRTSSEDSFARECRVLMSLRHPAIVSAYTSGAVGGVRYLVMEYVDGLDAIDLRRHKGGPLSRSECAELLLPVADALAYCHSKGIFHGDVSPKNILIQHSDITNGGAPSARLVDFGGSWVSSEGTEGDVSSVNMDFQPMERHDPTGMDPTSLGETSDIYALAATAYFLTAGRGPAGRVLSSDERTGGAGLESGDDEAWNAMLVWALHPDRAQRMPSMSLFRSLLRAWLPDSADRVDGSRFEPFWANEPEVSRPIIVDIDDQPTEPLDAEFVEIRRADAAEGWWFNMMLESLPEHGTTTQKVGTTMRLQEVQPAFRSLPMLAMGLLLAFIAGVSFADVLDAPDCETEECR